MIIECPKCGMKNSTDKIPQPGRRYRCGKCGALITFTQTLDTQGIFTEVSPKKAPPKSQEEIKREQVPKERKKGCLGCLGMVAAFIIIVVAINLSSSGDKTQQTPSTQTPTETQTVTENPRYIYQDGAIHVGGDGEPIELIDNPDAVNPTYNELLAFIKQDITDTKRYSEGIELKGRIILANICADFAEEVHNNAEAKGIKAAWVGIDFRGGGDGHALNAFETTDRGLVYVDCTGAILSLAERFRQVLEASSSQTPSPKPTSQDKIAYIEVGKEYGVVSLEYASSPDYEFYQAYLREYKNLDGRLEAYNYAITEFNRKMETYNREVEAYEKLAEEYQLKIGGREVITDSTEYKELSAMYDELQRRQSGLEQEESELAAERSELEHDGLYLDGELNRLGSYKWTPLGIVKDIYIRW